MRKEVLRHIDNGMRRGEEENETWMHRQMEAPCGGQDCGQNDCTVMGNNKWSYSNDSRKENRSINAPLLYEKKDPSLSPNIL